MSDIKKHKCGFCTSLFKTMASLLLHQRTARYCLEIQEKPIEEEYDCGTCDKKFSLKHHLAAHEPTCKGIGIKLQKENEELKKTVSSLEKTISSLTKTISSLEENLIFSSEKILFYKDQAEKTNDRIATIAQQPKNVNKNIVNTYIEKLEILSTESIQSHLPNLTIEHVNNGPKGYATFALAGPFKDRVVCTDASRKTLKYRDENKLVQTDQGGIALGQKFFKTVQPRSIEILMKEQEEVYNNTEIDAEDRLSKMMEIAKEIISIRSIARGDKEGEEYRDDFAKYIASGSVLAK